MSGGKGLTFPGEYDTNIPGTPARKRQIFKPIPRGRQDPGDQGQAEGAAPRRARRKAPLRFDSYRDPDAAASRGGVFLWGPTRPGGGKGSP